MESTLGPSTCDVDYGQGVVSGVRCKNRNSGHGFKIGARAVELF